MEVIRGAMWVEDGDQVSLGAVIIADKDGFLLFAGLEPHGADQAGFGLDFHDMPGAGEDL